LVTTQAYCVKCKSKRDMKNEKQVTMKNGRKAVSGICTVCGTKMFRIGGGGVSSSSAAGLAVAKQRPKLKAASKKSSSKAKKAGKSKTKRKKK
jgi:2-keto-3-deoxy-L-rhamnonate aldolase RhmA